ncbi:MULTISPECIES: iron uptake porin [Leptolyngbya]|uniref:iron uptake porin n=1 Tax=Leptolyngbya TaxID=47251 RepID=UPI00168875A9|nr:iron uptake porin [Leptolyngbya sp. FACHB-1624]MBD1854717.1 carbohydrate porin [Leptolyngbya sp. FACHB-1624]
MFNFLRHGLGQGFAVFFSIALLNQVATAQEGSQAVQSENLTKDLTKDLTKVSDLADSTNQSFGQVTSVSQLSDVRPTDWAFQALQSLVERYGCIAGYPDRTYRGNRALTRYEFAAGLNACLDRVNELIAASTADLVKKEDLATLQKLQEQFAAELATLRGRVDSLEARTSTIEKQQFSTTTKLIGNVVFGVAGAFGSDKAVSSSAGLSPNPPGQAGAPGVVPAQPRVPIDDNIIFSNRVRLVLTTSFTGRDKLITRLQAGNTPNLALATGTDSAKLSFQETRGNQVVINQLEYRFPLGDRGTAFIEAFGFLDLFVPTLHPLDGDYDTVLTGFSLRSPIYFPSGVTGVGFNYNITDTINIGGGYLAGNPTANNPSSGGGLFNGPYGALGQVTFRPNDKFAIALTYLNAYDDGTGNAPPGGFFGSKNAAFPFGATPVVTNGFGVQAEYRFSPTFSINGWYYRANASSKSGVTDGADATIQAWAVALAFPDLGKKGNLGGLIVGMPSKATSNDVQGFRDPNTSIQIEAFYRYMLNDKIGITPGLIVITNPEHNSANDTVYLGVLRTTFNF